MSSSMQEFDAGPDPSCKRCRGSGECPNAQFRCHCRWKPVPPLKYHGGKFYLAKQIVGLMPKHTHYIEPFAGGLAVLLAKDPHGISEVANDLDGNLTNFWRVLQDTATFERFARIVQAVPFSQVEWREADVNHVDPIRRAVAFFIRCRQSLAGRQDTFAPLSRRRTRRGMNEQASAWWNAIDGLRLVHERLRRVVILNRPALDVIRQEDWPDTLIYADPPYLPTTRAAPDTYAHEMSEAEHRELLDVLRSVAGKVMLSGYPSPLYDETLHDWTRHTFVRPNNAASGKTKRRETEVVWCNF